MGVEIDRYENLTGIGSGGFSQVYEAWQPNFNRKVAVKVLTLQSGLEVDQQAFELECRAMGSVSEHPHIVTVYDSGATKAGQPFIAMELYQETLLDRIQSRGPIPVAEVLEFGVLLCGALQRAHDAGILHRDIKPQNIFFSAYGTPALGDFGIASVASDRASQESMGMSMHYAAPEIIEGDRPSIESDLYSLGATLYTALARQRPFMRAKGESEAALIQRIRTETPPPISAQQLPRHVETAIIGLLAKHRNDRPRSALELANILRAQQTRLGLPATTVPLAEIDFDDDHTKPKTVTPADVFEDDGTAAAMTGYKAKVTDRATDDYREPEKSRRGLLAGALLVGAIAVVGGGILLTRSGEAASPTTTSPMISAPASTVVVDRSPPLAPTDVVQVSTEEGVEITWTAPERADRYNVRLTGGIVETRSTEEPRFLLEPIDDIVCLTVVAISEQGRGSPPSESVCVTP